MDKLYPDLGQHLEKKTTVAIACQIHGTAYFQPIRPAAISSSSPNSKAEKLASPSQLTCRTGPHPYGTKAVGEVNMAPPMAAVANAIDNAIHWRLTELPMSPRRKQGSLR